MTDTTNRHNEGSVPPTPIQQYLSSLSALDRVTDVIVFGVPMEDSEQKWSLRNVKAHFEKNADDRDLSQGPYLFTSLLSDGIPSNAAKFNTDRNNNQELLRLIREKADFLCRTFLGEEGSMFSCGILEYETWMKGRQGNVLVLWRKNGNTGERDEGQFVPMLLTPGAMTIMPANREVKMVFNEEVLLEVGNIVPRRSNASQGAT